MLKVGARYTANLISMVAQQEGYMAALATGSRFIASEVARLPKLAYLILTGQTDLKRTHLERAIDAEAVAADLQQTGAELHDYCLNIQAFHDHIAAGCYPYYYAGGPIAQGGMREQKLLEYFVSLDLLQIKPTDVAIDVASEWSVFPSVVRRLTGARVYRQDLIYPPGMYGDRIGGNAAKMPIPCGFADKLVLHNAFEHFEGSADANFIIEAWRVLKPGGMLCILPLFVDEKYRILTDPLVNQDGVVWDRGAEVIELPLWHNRFGRYYDAKALQRRVLALADSLGFRSTIYRIINLEEVHPKVYLQFALIMQKPVV